MLDLGDPVTLIFTTTADGSYVTPTAVTLTVEQPDGTVTDPTVTSSGTGKHSATFTPAQAGRHAIRWLATGPGARSHTDVLNVRPAALLALCSLDGVKRHLNMDDVVVDDEELRGHVAAATAAVERHRAEVVARRSFTADVEGGRTLPRRPVIAVTSAALTDGGDAVDVSDWTADPNTGLVTVPDGTGAVTVEYVAGYRVVPDEFILAAEIIAAHLWETQRAQAAGPGLGGEESILTPSGMGFAIPSRAVSLLGGQPPVFA